MPYHRRAMFVNPAFTMRLLKPSHKWGRLAVLLIPVGVLGVWLKVLRIRAFFPDATFQEFATKLASDVFFGLAWVILWAALCAVGPGWLRTLNFYAAHAATSVVGLHLVLNHAYSVRTGTPLTIEKLAYAWQHRDDLAGLVGSEMDPSTVALIGVVIALTLVAPALLGRFLTGVVGEPSRRVRRVAVAAALALLIGSMWSAPTVSAAFSLAAPVQLAVAPVREATAYPSELKPRRGVGRASSGEPPPGGDDRRNLVVIVLSRSERRRPYLPLGSP